MYKKVIPGLFLTLFAVSAFASAPDFEKVDADQDGAVSQAEATAMGMDEELFVKADVNQDKQLSPEEYQVFMEPKG